MVKKNLLQNKSLKNKALNKKREGKKVNNSKFMINSNAHSLNKNQNNYPVSFNKKEFLTISDLIKILKEAPLRTELIIKLILETGCKLQEISYISLADVDKKNYFIILKKPRRKIKISNDLINLINIYLKNHPYPTKKSRLFFTRESISITPRRIEQLLYELSIKTGIELNYRILKKTFIINQLKNNIPLKDIEYSTGLKNLSNYVYAFLKGEYNEKT